MLKNIIRFLIILLGYSESASAAEQNLVFSISEIVFGPTVTEQTVSVSYATVPESTPTSGLGIKMFFDSSKLSIEDLDIIVTENLIGVTDSVELFQDDLDDIDADSTTDKFVILAYLDLEGSWLGSQATTELFTFSIKPAAERFTGSSSINFQKIASMGSVSKPQYLGVVSSSLPYSDGEGIPDVDDPNESLDTDGDGFDDSEELLQGTDPLDPSSCPGCFNWDVDQNGQVTALSDGLITLRFLFGFTGEGLIANALGSGAGRPTSPEIEEYLNSSGLELDIDGDGELKALTDGLLLLRYLFGFQGEVLVTGAVSDSATRRSAQEISNYISDRLPRTVQ